MPTTLKAAQATLRALGVTLRRTGYGPELRVNFRGGRAVSQFECLLGVESRQSASGVVGAKADGMQLTRLAESRTAALKR